MLAKEKQLVGQQQSILVGHGSVHRLTTMVDDPTLWEHKDLPASLLDPIAPIHFFGVDGVKGSVQDTNVLNDFAPHQHRSATNPVHLKGLLSSPH
jgi:hypothetical protein